MIPSGIETAISIPLGVPCLLFGVVRYLKVSLLQRISQTDGTARLTPWAVHTASGNIIVSCDGFLQSLFLIYINSQLFDNREYERIIYIYSYITMSDQYASCQYQFIYPHDLYTFRNMPFLILTGTYHPFHEARGNHGHHPHIALQHMRPNPDVSNESRWRFQQLPYPELTCYLGQRQAKEEMNSSHF